MITGGYGIRPYGFVFNACYRRGAFHMLPKKKGGYGIRPYIYVEQFFTPHPPRALLSFSRALFSILET